LDDDDSNFKACQESFFHKVPLPRDNILTIESYDDPTVAAQLYESKLQHVLQGRPIDMVLLGLGPDGHTASLFPNHELLKYSGPRMVMPIFDSPKPPSQRITLTLDTINSSQEVVFIATGGGKAARLQDILSPSDTCTTVEEGKWEESGIICQESVIFPPTLVSPARVTWLIDDPAAALIKAHPHIEFISGS
jgi:6-phosphogluconolactonase